MWLYDFYSRDQHINVPDVTDYDFNKNKIVSYIVGTFINTQIKKFIGKFQNFKYAHKLSFFRKKLTLTRN